MLRTLNFMTVLLLLSCTSKERQSDAVFLDNKTSLDFSIKNCSQYLHLVKSKNEKKRFAKLTILEYRKDSITFTIEVFRVDNLNDTLRISNFGITKYKYSKGKIQETLCAFLNK